MSQKRGKNVIMEGRDEIIGLAPADAIDLVIEAYKKDVDRTLLRENLRLTPEERLQKMASFVEMAEALRAAVRGEVKT